MRGISSEASHYVAFIMASGVADSVKWELDDGARHLGWCAGRCDVAVLGFS